MKCTLQSVYLVTWLDEMWANMYENHQMTFREWCLDQLTRFEFDLQTKSDIEAMVRALCTILGYSYEVASSHVLRVWYSSPMGSVVLTSSKRASSQGVPRNPAIRYVLYSHASEGYSRDLAAAREVAGLAAEASSAILTSRKSTRCRPGVLGGGGQR